MTAMSLRQIAKQLGITPAYLSYMVTGKRPWRRDLFERYSYLVNTSVNTQAERVNNMGWSGASRAERSAAMVGGTGLEPVTSAMSRQHSNQLS